MLSDVVLSAVMLNVANKPFVLSDVILSAVMLNVANKPFMLNGVMFVECCK
jgi:hypothetical protein